MLRVTREPAKNGLVIKLEGDLSQEVVDLVQQECGHGSGKALPPRLLLDLRDLKSADQAGLRLLRDLMGHREVKLINCSPLLLTLIDQLAGQP